MITDCPYNHVTSDVWDALEESHFAKRGSWPVDGGTLKQCASFREACREIWSLRAEWAARNNPWSALTEDGQ